MENLLEKTIKHVEQRKEWLAEAEQALDYIKSLPVEIQGLPAAGAADFTSGVLGLDLYSYPEIESIINALGDTSQLKKKFSSVDGSYNIKGYITANDGTKIRLSIYDIDNPSNCKVIKVEEWKKVISFKQECDE